MHLFSRHRCMSGLPSDEIHCPVMRLTEIHCRNSRALKMLLDARCKMVDARFLVARCWMDAWCLNEKSGFSRFRLFQPASGVIEPFSGQVKMIIAAHTPMKSTTIKRIYSLHSANLSNLRTNLLTRRFSPK
jgi:hypothetical protein